MITDIHLTGDNASDTIKLVCAAIDKAVEFKLKFVYVGGDVFDSRKAQSLKALEAWMEILRYAKRMQVVLRAIPGNHDKPSYKAERSYLDLYKDHESIELIRDYDAFAEGEYMVHMIPFFDEKEVYPQYLQRAFDAVSLIKDKKHMLITHVAIDGVKNNDGSEIEGTLPSNQFNVFERVFVGHYHDYQEIGNVVYFGSIKQKNFGENNKKGLTVFFEDGTWEQQPLPSKQYKVVKVNIDTITDKELTELMEENGGKEDNVRFKFTGTREKIKSIDKKRFESIGIDVKCEEIDPEVNLDYTELTHFEGFTKGLIKEGWEDFSESNEVDEDTRTEGRELLIKTLE